MVEPELENYQEAEFRLVVLESEVELLPDTYNGVTDRQEVVLETEPEVLPKPSQETKFLVEETDMEAKALTEAEFYENNKTELVKEKEPELFPGTESEFNAAQNMEKELKTKTNPSLEVRVANLEMEVEMLPDTESKEK